MANGISLTAGHLAERRLGRALLLGYCLFIVYGSFIPFHFSADPELVRSQLLKAGAQMYPFQGGVENFSIPDVVSNMLLFMPFGALVVAGRAGKAGRVLRSSVAVAWGLGFLFGLAIEAGQVFAPGRTASLLDALSNGLGAAGGGVAGYLLFGAAPARLGLLVLQLLRQRPALVLVAIVALVPAADAFYPFELTLDVSTASENMRQAQWVPFSHGPHRFLGDLLVEKVVVFAVLGDLARRSLTRRTAWLLTASFAAALEAGKLFFVGRAPNAENFVLSASGALLGILLVPRLANARLLRERPLDLLFGLALLLIAYEELTPFHWARSWPLVAAQAARVEWLPFASYYAADPQSALFDLGKKFFLGAPLGALAAARAEREAAAGRRAAIAWGAGIGAVLETLQLVELSHIPSTTDVLLFAGAAWAGAALFARYRAVAREAA